MRKRLKSCYSIQSVENALDVLEQIQNNCDGLGITELSNRLNMPKNKVFRILATLGDRDYVEQNNTLQKYGLGLKNLFLGQTFINQNGLLKQSRQVLEKLASNSHETSYVSVLRGFHVAYLEAVESDQIVRVVSRVGTKLPFYCTAAGKVLAAGINLECLLEHFHFDSIKKYTPNTINSLDALIDQLRYISQVGYAIDNEEFDYGVKCVGVPIRDYTKQIIGAVSISGPAMRMNTERLSHELIPLVKAAANEISSNLGFQCQILAGLSCG